MARPPKQPQRADVTPEERTYWDRAIRRYTGDPVPDVHQLDPYFGGLLASPPVCALACEMGVFVRNAGNRPFTYTHAQREFVDQILCKDLKTDNVLYFHILDAVSAGVRIEAIKAIREDREEEVFNDEERLLAKFIRMVLSGTVDDETWAQMEELFGSERGVVEYCNFVLWLHWIMRMMNALGTNPSAGQDIDQLIDDLASGRREPPDYRIGTSTPESRFAR
jgi:hypothetical protein